MRIEKLKTQLSEDGNVFLIKEKATNYVVEKEITSPNLVVKVMTDVFQIQKESEEYLYMICFNNKMKIRGAFEISHGTVDSSLASTREIFQKALLCNASRIIVIHNHPSGECNPSIDDVKTYNILKEAGNIMSIPVLDSIIIGRNTYYSIEEKVKQNY